MTAVAKALNEEWKGQDVQVFALTDYYEQGRVDYRAWLEAEFGYDDQTVGIARRHQRHGAVAAT